MDEQIEFVSALLETETSVAELCESYGVSRKTAYKWRKRYRRDGAAGLDAHSRAPHRPAHMLDAEVVEQFVACRRKHRTWGPKKIIAWLAAHRAAMATPAASTVARVLRRHGLSRRHRRSRMAPYTQSFQTANAANEVWGADFKGQFKVGDGSTSIVQK